ncbi:Single insulin-like growth factor-binding domain protein-2 [Armadillidium nasatum]|uniref:Single insulin-like growth factor-binding domain protein-2 n=1 Tax=Armadillidium nasatum TaxID=96803 RepID=A0A5N5TDZ8_9CRUS|nr:Single insulin-like growth factor-binding domain protein-2 [Armadillidium nasatum]
MCKPVKKPPCGTSYTFNDEEKAKILKFHNDIRRKTAFGKETNTSGKLPPACEIIAVTFKIFISDKSINKYTYSPLLLKPIYYSDKSINKYTRIAVRNIAMGFYKPNKPSNPVIDVVIKIIDQWYTSEVKNFLSENVCSYKFNSNLGHYSQLIWGDSCHIGCGLTYYEEDGEWNYLVACNYCKTGNLIGQIVYKTRCDATPHCDDCC